MFSGETGIGQANAPLQVLVVDDVDVNCRLAQVLLRKFGHVSEVATSGAQAIEMAAAGRYDVILMDVQMPDMDGMDAARRIIERLGTAAPRIIAVTANATTGHRERCLAAGMDDYLTKPLRHQELRAALEQRVGESAVPPVGGAEREQRTLPFASIDWRRIESLEPFDFDGSMVAGAIASFLADAPGRISAIAAAQATGDAAGLAAAAHALRGAAANIGATRMQELSQDIESLALAGNLERTRIPIGALDTLLADVRAALAAKRKGT